MLKRDLGLVFQKLEELQDQPIQKALEPKMKPAPEMTEAERNEALALLREPEAARSHPCRLRPCRRGGRAEHESRRVAGPSDQVFEHNGFKYILDGHHRAATARQAQAGIDAVYESVGMDTPRSYGYRSVDELIWSAAKPEGGRMSRELILALIHQYVAAVEQAVRLLVEATGTSEPLLAVRSGGFSRSGVLPNGSTYRFHGVGCEVNLGSIAVDFDWGPQGRHGGFDPWRLARFSEQGDNPQSETVLQTELAALERDGLTDAPRLDPSPHLYYLRSRSTPTSTSNN